MPLGESEDYNLTERNELLCVGVKCIISSILLMKGGLDLK